MGAWAGAAIQLGIGAFGMIKANGEYNKAQSKINTLNQTITDLENSRVAITNPYDAISDTSTNIVNEYENLSVATQAADFQAEQADIALANTLDTMRDLGQGAGGATALAQAALKSKQGISASIEQQEVANEKLRAQGAMQVNQMKMAESQRLQQADVAGRQFMYAEQDKRDLQQLDRTQAMLDQERVNSAMSEQAMYTMLGSMGSGMSNIFSSGGAGSTTGSGTQTG